MAANFKGKGATVLLDFSSSPSLTRKEYAAVAIDPDPAGLARFLEFPGNYLYDLMQAFAQWDAVRWALHKSISVTIVPVTEKSWGNMHALALIDPEKFELFMGQGEPESRINEPGFFPELSARVVEDKAAFILEFSVKTGAVMVRYNPLAFTSTVSPPTLLQPTLSVFDSNRASYLHVDISPMSNVAGGISSAEMAKRRAQLVVAYLTDAGSVLAAIEAKKPLLQTSTLVDISKPMPDASSSSGTSNCPLIASKEPPSAVIEGLETFPSDLPGSNSGCVCGVIVGVNVGSSSPVHQFSTIELKNYDI